MEQQTIGKVWLVGAGPGDAGLMTLKGRSILEQADTVLYDSLVGEGILGWIPSSAETIFVGKRAGNHPVPQDEINHLLLEKASAGKKVVRLKGGDPFLFGRGGEELELLAAHKIPFEIVPGVTSAVAVPAYAGIPVTHRDCCSSVHIITGHAQNGSSSRLDYDPLVKLNGTLVFLMGVTALPDICSGLLEAGMPCDTPAAIVENGTTSRQRQVVCTLAELPQKAEEARIAAPSVILVGNVCALAKTFSWREDPRFRPLEGLRIFVTRPKERASSLSHRLSHLGAEVIELPSIEIVPIPHNKDLAHALEQYPRYAWAAFTSPSGVDLFFSSLRDWRIDIRTLSSWKFAAIGPATRDAIESRGILVDLMPETYNAAALAHRLTRQMRPGQRVLLPRAREGSPSLTEVLSAGGIAFHDLPIYETIYPKQTAVSLKPGDLAAFTSASTVRGFVRTMEGTDFHLVQAVCIGEQTAREARLHGMQTVVAPQATIDSLVECVTEFYQKERSPSA